MTRLLCVRHGPATSTGICYGRFEIETNESELALESLKTCLTAATLGKSTCLWSSPALRCRKVANFLASELDLTANVDERMAELSFGDWEGRAWSELEALPEFAHWMQHWAEVAPPLGESLLDLEARTSGWCRDLRGADVHLVVTHAGVIRQFMVMFRGLTWKQALEIPISHLTPFEFTARNS